MISSKPVFTVLDQGSQDPSGTQDKEASLCQPNLAFLWPRVTAAFRQDFFKLNTLNFYLLFRPGIVLCDTFLPDFNFPCISAAHVLVSDLSLLICSFWVWQTPGKMKYSVYAENDFTAFVCSTGANIWNGHSQGISERHNHCFDTTVPQQKWDHITFLLAFALCLHFR